VYNSENGRLGVGGAHLTLTGTRKEWQRGKKQPQIHLSEGLKGTVNRVNSKKKRKKQKRTSLCRRTKRHTICNTAGTGKKTGGAGTAS